MATCSKERCGWPARYSGLCAVHYWEMVQGADPRAKPPPPVLTEAEKQEEITTRREVPNPLSDPPPAIMRIPPRSSPSLLRWYREHTDGLTRQRLTFGAYGVVAVAVLGVVGALVHACSTAL